jgi:PadR family transcriptional regulator, regulatory protein PadR
MFDRELLKGSSALLLLQMLNERDMYGYELAKEMEQRSDAQLIFKEGTLYPSLHKLETKGLVRSYWKPQDKGPDRKYYGITEEGRAWLQSKTQEWNRFVSIMGKMLGGGANEPGNA